MKFSIIMPTYNCEKYVLEAVKSVLSQTYTDFELIIVDDGSEDRTYNVCLKLVDEDPRIALYTVEHGGVSAARNFGLSKAHGEYVLFIDGDDMWKPELLSSVLDSIDESDDLLIFGMQRDWYLSDDIFQYSEIDLGDSGEIEKLQKDIATNHLFSTYNMASPCNKVYKAEIIKKNRVHFSEKCVYLEDLKFNFDYLQNTLNAIVLQKDLYQYRLFLDKKQILKRRFGDAFLNADELFASAGTYVESRGENISGCSVIVGVVLKAYINELLARAESISATELRALLNKLNKNDGFCCLLKAAKGKFYSLIRLLGMFGAYGLQFRFIQKHKNS